jgi:hypothetical protein
MALAINPGPYTYLQVKGDVPADIPEGTFVSVERATPLKIYSLGFQPAKSIPELPRWFLTRYGQQSFRILEPFAGSGTTVLEALSYGASVLWLDYNPLSRLICQVKTTRVNLPRILESAMSIISHANARDKAPETIRFANKDFWFQKPVQEALELLREGIAGVEPDDQPVLWLAFASTVRKASDMNDGMILAAKRSHIQETPARARIDVYKYFQQYLHKTVDALAEWYTIVGDRLRNSIELSSEDARDLAGNWRCDAVITSPPYINAIDYIWASKFELHWLGVVANDMDRLNLYSREIGTERISRDDCRDLGRTGIAVLDSLIEEIYEGRQYQASNGQNHLRARVVYKYFMDMKDHFEAAHRHIRPGGLYCFSIGNMSRICGVDIPVAGLLTEIAHNVGFHEQFHFHLLLKNRKLNLPRNVEWAGTIKHDTTVVLEKPNPHGP